MIVQHETSTIRNNTWRGAKYTITDNGEPIPLDGATVETRFRKGDVTGEIAFILSSNNGNIKITDPGVIEVLPVSIEQEQGVYYGDLQINRGGVVDTYVRIKLTVEPTTNYQEY